MSYLDYIVLFEKYDQQHRFSGNATRLYLKLLHVANLVGWPVDFAKPDPYVAAICGCSENTMRDCRTKLVAAGLLGVKPGKMGRGAVTTYRLLAPEDEVNKVSNSDTLPENKGSNSDTLPPDKVSEFEPLPAENGGKGSDKGSNFDTLSIDKEEGVVGAANAATPTAPLPAKKTGGKRAKKAGATPEELAALIPPHDGAEFAALWATFLDGPKQVGKPASAFRLLLKKLAKYPEGFAIVMLEKSIEGNWSGVEYDSTPATFRAWQAQQLTAPPAPTAAPTCPGINEEFVAQQEAAALAARRDRFAQYAAAPEPNPALTP